MNDEDIAREAMNDTTGTATRTRPSATDMESEPTPWQQARECATEAVGKSRGDWLHLVYELWQHDLIDEDLYLRAVQADINRKKEK